MKSILRYLACALTTLLLLNGCSTPEQLKKRHTKLKNKMDKKGVFIPKDTLHTTDTLTITEIIGDTVYITKEITHTLEPEVVYKTLREVKYETKYKYKTVKVENKAMVDSLRLELRNERKQQKQTNRPKRRNWWIWLLVGLGLGVFHKELWQIFRSKLKI